METSARQPNFSQEETDALVREVQSRSGRIYGHANRPPRVDDAKAAWEEVSAAVNQVCPDVLRTAAQCKKRFNDVRRRAKLKLSQHPAHHKGGGGGGGGRTAAAGGRGEEKEGEDEDDCEEEDQGEPEPVPETREGAGRGDEPATRGRRRNRVQREDQPFLDTQRAGFLMLERELGSMGTRLGSLEAQVKALQEVLQASLLPLAAGVATLQRLVQVAERLLPPAESSAPACPRWPLRPRTGGGRPPGLTDRLQRPDPRGGGGGGGGGRRRRRGVGRGETQ
ncbi:myb-related transcription factor%2C partner of profilin-like [Xyrichtys novacula]|uniref:Myb-related transcription factor, partner of profilin-like n=1 Tax=Xyrichtys novacula TaxID=13765 RepID=A0AAV1HR62_XYRNO|nr:myb-related transcription factor%2C partner of profilin-like [Xyrichtys novacula]